MKMKALIFMQLGRRYQGSQSCKPLNSIYVVALILGMLDFYGHQLKNMQSTPKDG